MKVLLVLLALTLGAVEPGSVAQPGPKVTVTTRDAGPNFWVIIAAQAAGGPDSLFYSVTQGASVIVRKQPASVVRDSFSLPKPASPVTGQGCVQSKRRGQLSNNVCKPWTSPTEGPPPDPIIDVTVDTTVIASGDTTYLRATFESGTYDGMTADVGPSTTVSVTGPIDGVSPAEGNRMVKLSHPSGSATGSSYAQLRKRLDNNPARTTKGLYIQYRVYIPVATMVNANSTVYGTDAQIKTHLFRVPSQNPADYSPPAYAGLVLGVGYTFGSKFSIAKDYLNIWIADATNAVDDGGPWTKYPRYTGNAWLTVQEWYHTSDGINTEYKLWLNGRLTKAETFSNLNGTHRLIGGATSTPWEFRVGMPYLVNRSTGAYVIYVDDVTIKNGPIT
jgi:hypothetical protein